MNVVCTVMYRVVYGILLFSMQNYGKQHVRNDKDGAKCSKLYCTNYSYYGNNRNADIPYCALTIQTQQYKMYILIVYTG